ncbi:MAG: RimK family alpha-L-glutamate ligase [Candidatus Bathyarchaeota archaeon]|nr:RimK family alpha-L-glutamate ligase [Candidatus Bathyarchaeota archaeon]
MKTLVVYGRALDANVKQLYNACKEIAGKTILARIMDMSAYVGSDGSRFWHGDLEITGVNLCLLRSFGSGSYEQVTKRVSMIEHMESSGTPVVNPTRAYQKTKDKYSMIFTLAGTGLPIPETYVTEMAHWAYRASRNFREIVYKPIVGSLGFGSMKFSDADMAFNAFKRLESLGQPIYLQEHLEKPGRDIRAFVVGEEVLASIYRIARADEWKTNVAQRGKAKSTKLSGELQELAVRAVEALELIYAGVDILETEQGPVLLEVNASPGWQGLQKATGLNVARQIVQYVVNLAKC